MNWTRLAAVVIGTGVASSLTKWFFAGDWLHLRWTYPEIWRAGEGRANPVKACFECHTPRKAIDYTFSTYLH